MGRGNIALVAGCTDPSHSATGALQATRRGDHRSGVRGAIGDPRNACRVIAARGDERALLMTVGELIS